MFCLAEILFYKKIDKRICAEIVQAAFAFRFIDVFISFNLEVSDKSFLVIK